MFSNTLKLSFLVFFIYSIMPFGAENAIANNIQIGTPSLTGENRTQGYVFVTFDLSWENSWRGTEANNWDAAWVFVKFRVGGGEWQHAKLHNTDHLPGAGTPAVVSAGLVNEDLPFEPTGNPAVGAFIYRSIDGFGTFSTVGNKLRWNYAAQGITNATTLEVNVYAIEMVYVPEGEFNVGGGGGTGAFNSTTINTADATVTPSGVGSLGGQAGGYPTGVNPPASPNWPNGFSAFYCMKYEISQQQYVDFLNSLTPMQSINRVDYAVYYGWSSYGYHRYTITGDGTGGFTTNNPEVACGVMKIDDISAYAEWSGLRPMSELEYEKSCRGNKPPVINEYAWGNSLVVNQSYALTNLNLTNENITANYSMDVGNAVLFGGHSNNGLLFDGPFRVGIFASNNLNSGRVSSGASYFGIMELSGNLLEMCTSLNDSFDRKHGSGNVSVDGNSTSFFPNFISFKGGGFAYYGWHVSYRELHPIQSFGRDTRFGGRVVRSE